MRPSRGGENLCRKAREYYYDLLYGDRDAVPEVIVRHVEHCSTCRQQIERLRAAFTQTEGLGGRPVPSADQATLDTLSRQFELLGECVTCSQAGPFLPELLLPFQEIRIPTPVTVHVENCPRCAKALAMLGEQGLTAGQLKRLSLFYGLSADQEREPGRRHGTPALGAARVRKAKATESQGSVRCRLARPAIAALAAFSLDDADPEALRHVIACPQCRTRVYRRRGRIMDDLPAGAGRDGGLVCTDILARDLFDGVMPLGLEATTAGGSQERRDAVFAHVRTCRQCMEKAQSLHRTIYAIGERTDSGVDTIYRMEPETEAPGERPEAAVYRYPVRVQVIRHEVGRAAHTAGRGLADMALRHSAGLASAAVLAVIVIALSLMNTSTATATIAGEIRQALERATNIHILQFHRARPQPIQELWIARDLDLLATRDPSGHVELTDFAKGNRTIAYPDGSPGRHVELSRRAYEGNRELMALSHVLACLPADADLKPAESEASDAVSAAVTLYERTWEDPTPAGRSIPRRLTVAVDPATQLPERMILSGRNEQGQWEPVTTTVFEYLDDSQMDDTLTELLAAQ